ncbi:MAG: hypothetical protein AAGN82_04555 [Myxococcota bacterium]
MKSLVAAALLVTVLAVPGCTGTPAPGELGTPRYAGLVPEATPLPMAPPIHDRDGNAYVGYGDIDTLQVETFVGHQGRGWTGGCAITSANQPGLIPPAGLHGWVGRGQSRAWYWAGTALVRMTGTTGDCRRIFETDPSSDASLNFLAVLPSVRITPSLTSLVALIFSPTDPLPFLALIDLQAERYIALEEFEPSGATNVEVLGVGADSELQEGVMIVRYNLGEQIRTDARFYDFDAQLLASVRLTGLEQTRPYGLRGYLHADDNGLWAGIDYGTNSDGEPVSPPLVLVLDKSGAELRAPNVDVPVGIHKWDGNLYLVGEHRGEPAYAAIDDEGRLERPEPWEASLAFAENLGRTLDVLDDRNLPSREVEWDNPRTAMGRFPFLSEHRLDPYADGTSAWLVAGPFFDSNQPQTAVAYVPAGVAYDD